MSEAKLRTEVIQLDPTHHQSVTFLGEGPPVLLLHGIPGSAKSWMAVGEALERAQICAVVPDLIGFGGSSTGDGLGELHAKGQSQFLAHTLDALAIRPVAVIGHDFGGPVALALAVDRPDLVTALGLLATNTFTDTPVPFPLSLTNTPLLGGLFARGLFSSWSLRMMLRQGVRTVGVRLDSKDSVGSGDQASAIRTIFHGSLRNLRELYGPIESALRQLVIPGFVAWGDRDPFFSVEQGQRTAAAFAGSDFELIDGAGHFLPEERPIEIANLIINLVRHRAVGKPA